MATKASAPNASKIVAIVNDIHFDLHDEPTWRAFRKWHTFTKPYHTIFLGDFLDLGMVSSYVQGPDAPLYAVKQIKYFVNEANAIRKEASKVTCIEGNHENRWDRKVMQALGPSLRGSYGLTLRDQCYAQGLDSSIEYLVEDTKMRGIKCGPFILRHGDKQVRGKFGGGKYLAANKLTKSMGESEIFGHFHRSQMHCQTSGGRTAIVVASPAMTGDHGYMLDPDWQRGFTILELFGNKDQYATVHPIIIDHGCFAFNGRVYDGNKKK